MFERFTDRARRVVVLAQEEARMLCHGYIGTEHLLLGLIREGEGTAAKALQALGLGLEDVRGQVEQETRRGPRPPSGHIPFTTACKHALEASLREAGQLGNNYIGTEHLLLGLLSQPDSPGPQTLVALGTTPDRIREEVITLVTGARQGADRGRRTRPGELGRFLDRFEAVETRLSSLEDRVGTAPGVRDLASQLAELRHEKEAAIDAQNVERAAELRDAERELMSEKERREQEWNADGRDSVSLTEEVERLRRLIREHGIDPQDGAA
jgi:ATP-dependent Clp protease ATP-binding subunit ClpA